MFSALYVLKSALAAFRNHLADCMQHLVLFPCPANLDVWMKPMMRPEDVFNYYVYVLIYVEDLIVIHNDSDSVIRRIDNYSKLNPSWIGDPDIYLEAKSNNMRLDNRVCSW